MKYTKLYILLISFTSTYLFGWLDITQYGYEQYQDIIINGVVVQKAANHKDRDPITRYNIINNFLNRYKRPFTMLDIGASQGYYSFRAAQDHPNSVFVMLEGNNHAYKMVGTQILDLCKENTDRDNIILLNKQIEPTNIQRLSECEHFDVVLVMNILHWFPNNWKQLTDAILNLGDYVILETPPNPGHNIRKRIEDYIQSKNAIVLGKVKRHNYHEPATMWLVETKKKYLERTTWVKPRNKKQNYTIKSTFEEKKLEKKMDNNMTRITDWVPGINLITYKMYNGTYPTVEKIKQMMNNMQNIHHRDWMLNNMILQGNKIALIDNYDPFEKGSTAKKPSPSRVQEMLSLMDNKDLDSFTHFFIGANN